MEQVHQLEGDAGQLNDAQKGRSVARRDRQAVSVSTAIHPVAERQEPEGDARDEEHPDVVCVHQRVKPGRLAGERRDWNVPNPQRPHGPLRHVQAGGDGLQHPVPAVEPAAFVVAAVVVAFDRMGVDGIQIVEPDDGPLDHQDQGDCLVGREGRSLLPRPGWRGVFEEHVQDRMRQKAGAPVRDEDRVVREEGVEYHLSLVGVVRFRWVILISLLLCCGSRRAFDPADCNYQV